MPNARSTGLLSMGKELILRIFELARCTLKARELSVLFRDDICKDAKLTIIVLLGVTQRPFQAARGDQCPYSHWCPRCWTSDGSSQPLACAVCPRRAELESLHRKLPYSTANLKICQLSSLVTNHDDFLRPSICIDAVLRELDISAIEFSGIRLCSVEGLSWLKEFLSRKGPLLRELSFDRCGFNDERAQPLAESISSLTGLKTLSLSEASFSDLGCSVLVQALSALPAFKSLTLSDVFQRRVWSQALVCGALRALPALTSLDMSMGKLGREGGELLAAVLRSSTSIESLDVSSNNLGDEGTDCILKALQAHSRLSELDIRNNEIGVEGAKSLSAAVLALPKLTSLDVGENRIGSPGVIELSNVLGRLPALTRFSIRGNEVDSEGVDHLANALGVGGLTRLRVLDLGMNAIGDEGARHLSSAARVLTALQALDLCESGLGPESAVHVSAMLNEMTSLTFLNLGDNELGGPGASALSEALAKLRLITQLDISSNKFDGTAVEALSQAIGTFSDLKTLLIGHDDLSQSDWIPIAAAASRLRRLDQVNAWPKYGRLRAGGVRVLDAADELSSLDVGVALVSSMLCRSGETMTSLDLSKNEIGDDGSAILSEGLSTLSILTSINLSECEIAAEGARCLCAALRVLTCLTSVNLRSNRLGCEGIGHLAPALPSLPSLASLNVSRNNIGGRGAALLAVAITQLPSLTSLDIRWAHMVVLAQLPSMASLDTRWAAAHKVLLRRGAKLGRCALPALTASQRLRTATT